MLFFACTRRAGARSVPAKFVGKAAVLGAAYAAGCLMIAPMQLLAVDPAVVVEAGAGEADDPVEAGWLRASPSANSDEKVSSGLRHLINQIGARGVSREAILASRPSLLTSRLRRITDDGLIQCYVVYQASSDAAVAAITAVGGTVELVCRLMGLVQARVPYDEIDALAAFPAIKQVRLPAYHRSRTGSVTSQGDAVLRANLARDTYGLTGAGIKVGVISDGINGIGASQSTGDIPPTY
jgi:hypothetical protein